MRFHLAGLLVSVATINSVPAGAQNIFQSVKALKSTLHQLSGPSMKAANANAISAAGEQSEQTESEATDLIPASALIDDPSDSSLEQAALIPRKVQTFDILGYKLGMTPREVVRVSKKVHCRRRWNSVFLLTGTFELEASSLANYQLNQTFSKRSKVQISKTQGFLPDGSEVMLTFTLEPTGPKLSEINYTTKLNGMTQQQFLASAIKKYGPYDEKGLLYSWRNGATDMLKQGREPYLFINVDSNSVSLSLRQSSDYLEAAKKRLQARGQEIAAQRGGGVKF